MEKDFQIIHICEDEKFINSAIEQFEDAFPGLNIFFVSSDLIEGKFKHITENPFTHRVLQEDLCKIEENFFQNGLVILHSLSPQFYDFVLNLPKSIPVICLWFGFEVYRDSDYYHSEILLDKITFENFPQKNVSRKKKFREDVRPIYRLIKPHLPFSKKEYKRRVLKRLDFFGCPFKEEYQSMCKLLSIKRSFFNFWYYPLEIILNVNKPIYLPKDKLIIGNAGFVSLNHLDVFSKIKSFQLKGLEIIVPLNYGEPNYINQVISNGERCFQENFKPLLEFISLPEYNIILESVAIAILNNRRQQAIGNTIALLWFGAKVFLSVYNPFFSFLRRIGVQVYSYEHDLNSESIKLFLCKEEIENNRRVLFKELNKSHLSNLLKDQILSLNV